MVIMSAAPPTESVLATRIDLEPVGVAAAVLDYSNAAKRLSRLSQPFEALDDPWVVHELAATVTFMAINHPAAAILGVPRDRECPARVFSMVEGTAEVLAAFRSHLVAILTGSLTSHTELPLPDERTLLFAWQAADTTYSDVVITLLDVPASDAGAATVPVNLNSVVEATIAAARNEWRPRCEVAIDLDDGLPSVPAFDAALNDAILVLIRNAAQAVQHALGDSDQKGTIAISTTQRSDTAVLKITDSGAGIPAEIQSCIFDPFFTTKEAGRGSGLGLTICRNVIVEQHGGALEFETEPGVGTTFTITLPLHIGEDHA
jgi:hypothetical protein